MRSRALSLAGAATLGFAAAAVLFAAWSARPASAQFGTVPVAPIPGGPIGISNPSAAAAPQPIEIEALDPRSFVVATREPRLVTQAGREGVAQNMLVTVVTHYTVREDRLIPVEHVRVPEGYRPVQLAE